MGKERSLKTEYKMLNKKEIFWEIFSSRFQFQF